MKIRLCKMDDDGKPSGNSWEADDKDAIEAVIAGTCLLHPRQSAPPWPFLEVINASTGAFERAGPSCDNEAIARLNRDLLPSMVRQSTVGGHHVRWIRTSSYAEAAFRKAVLGPNGKAASLSSQVGATLSYRLNRKNAVSFPSQPSSDEVLSYGLVEVNPPVNASFDIEWCCYTVGADWYAFRDALREVSKNLNASFVKALKQGRVIAVEELFPGGRLVHPEYWLEHGYETVDLINDWFLFTRDLPAGWFKGEAPKPGATSLGPTKVAKKRGRPPGTGLQVVDAPFVDMIIEAKAREPGATTHRVTQEIVAKHREQIAGPSDTAKVRRLMERVSEREAGAKD